MSVKYVGTSELIIHHAYKVSNEDLLRTCIGKSQSMPTLYWCNGTIFFFEQMMPIMNAEVEKDFLTGRDHWAEVYYSEMKSYKDMLELGDGEFRGAKVRIIDASGFAPHEDFAAWAKSH